MTAERPDSRHTVPTLTEVVAVPDALREARAPAPSGTEPAGETPSPLRAAGASPSPPSVPAPMETAAAAPASSASETPDAEALAERILAQVQAQVDELLEYRLREVLTPILARASDALVRDARNELSRSLKEVVARSVARELHRQRTR